DRCYYNMSCKIGLRAGVQRAQPSCRGVGCPHFSSQLVPKLLPECNSNGTLSLQFLNINNASKEKLYPMTQTMNGKKPTSQRLHRPGQRQQERLQRQTRRRRRQRIWTSSIV